ncbi:MAG: hypothetical protein AB7G93_07140 [Bdellovibrionales bacterium]
MAKRSEVITADSLSGLLRHHPYLLILQKEDWRDYLVLLGEIYDVLEEQSGRVPMEAVRSVAFRFYAGEPLAFPEQKASAFLNMAIAELQVLKDSHDQFGQRYVEATRAGKSLLQLFEGLVAQRGKFSGTGAETLLGALNDILISRGQMTEAEAIQHHREKIEALKADIVRIKKEGLAAAQLLPIAHSNEALFSQAEEAAVHVLQSIEDVKSAIEQQRKDLAAVYFSAQRSAGETLGAVADFYEALYRSPAYASYIQAKDLLSHLDGFQARFATRNVDRLLYAIEQRSLVEKDLIKKSNLLSFMHLFAVADASIQEKIKSQIYILQQQVLYAVSTDVEGLRSNLHDLLSNLVSHPGRALEFCEAYPVTMRLREDLECGPVELFDFELPAEVTAEELTEQAFDLMQERELLLALVRAEEGTLKDILNRLHAHFERNEEFHARDHSFPRGLAEYYVLSEAELFDPVFEKSVSGPIDLTVESKYGRFVLREVPDFVLKKKLEGFHNANG